VTITLTDGRRLQRRVAQAKGQPKNPLTEAELSAKFRDCAARVLPSGQVDVVVELVGRLETLPEVGVLAGALSRV
jgi:2-methylcitrate dehydratase PrpD